MTRPASMRTRAGHLQGSTPLSGPRGSCKPSRGFCLVQQAVAVMTEIRNSVILDLDDSVITDYDDRHKKNLDGLWKPTWFRHIYALPTDELKLEVVRMIAQDPFLFLGCGKSWCLSIHQFAHLPESALTEIRNSVNQYSKEAVNGEVDGRQLQNLDDLWKPTWSCHICVLPGEAFNVFRDSLNNLGKEVLNSDVQRVEHKSIAFIRISAGLKGLIPVQGVTLRIDS